ncbi:hypothetical protein K7X08_017799 [Anisodus acutangulus]|uniref:Zinc finger ZPR1-type domain-containing protein n=1 Tax=Anisodus acutangulus TaxID=402998 RepID=A0A9Q1LWL5_9SOLA|nr:hypothetical protein K7X08_017799 [Anisodus acutangulus]
MAAPKEQIMDVRSVVEAVAAAGDDVEIDTPLYVVESLCMRCGENGTTRFLLTLIPHFRKILLSAFDCPHCGESLRVPSGDQKMLDRTVVKSESAIIKIPELDFEIPPEAQRGSLSSIEGILKVDPQMAEAIDQFLIKLRACASGDLSFTYILDDPAGNSFIENPLAPSPDPSLIITFYDRTPEQQAALGYLANPSQLGGQSYEVSSEGINNIPHRLLKEPHGSVGARAGRQAIAQGNSAEMAEALFRYSAPEEVMMFPSTCGACAAKCDCKMFVTNIPYFQEVIVMASSCDACGYRNSELKPGGPISDKGKKITLHVENIKDLSRDVIKSDSAGVEIPELELELTSGTLGGMVTTVEGLVTKISESLERVHGFTFGDSLPEDRKSKWLDFRARLDKVNVERYPLRAISDKVKLICDLSIKNFISIQDYEM